MTFSPSLARTCAAPVCDGCSSSQAWMPSAPSLSASENDSSWPVATAMSATDYNIDFSDVLDDGDRLTGGTMRVDQGGMCIWAQASGAVLTGYLMFFQAGTFLVTASYKTAGGAAGTVRLTITVCGSSEVMPDVPQYAPDALVYGDAVVLADDGLPLIVG